MWRRITTILLVILLISGFGVIAYPWVSDWINAKAQTHVIKEYQNNVSKMDTDEIQEVKNDALTYDRTEVSSGITDPFGKMQTTTEGNVCEEGSYANVLNVGDIMGYLDIPKIKVSLPIYHGTSELAMQEGVGHMEGTSMPIGGYSTHCVLASHSGMTDAKLFTDLNKLALGDKFYLTVLDDKLTYQVDQIDIVLPSDTSKLEVVPGEDYVTLLTCTPIGSNTHRLLVRGKRISNEDSVKDFDTETTTSKEHISDVTILRLIWWILPLMLIAVVVFFFFRKYGKKL